MLKWKIDAQIMHGLLKSEDRWDDGNVLESVHTSYYIHEVVFSWVAILRAWTMNKSLLASQCNKIYINSTQGSSLNLCQVHWLLCLTVPTTNSGKLKYTIYIIHYTIYIIQGVLEQGVFEQGVLEHPVHGTSSVRWNIHYTIYVKPWKIVPKKQQPWTR